MNLYHLNGIAMRTLATTAAVACAAVLFTACGGVVTAHPTSLPPTTPSPATPAPAPTIEAPSSAPASASVSASAIGGDPGTWSPLRITGDDNGKAFTMVPGQVAVLVGLPMNDGEDLNVDVTDQDVAMFQRGESSDGSVSAPVIIAKAPGITDVVFSYDEQGDTSGTNVAFKVTISVQDQ